MWPWIKRLSDWGMRDLWPMHRIGPQPQALHFSYEKAGLTVHDQPIPWNAEAVLVDVMMRLPPAAPRRKHEFTLRIPGQVPVLPDSFRRDENDEHHQLSFRLTPPGRSINAELIFKERVLAQLTLPSLSREEFLRSLELYMPTLAVRIGTRSVACQTFVATQCRGLLASALLSSQTSLAPLLDLNLHLELRSERGKVVHVPASLSSSQLAGRQALLTLVPAKFPRRIGTWLATWVVGDRPILTQQLRAISQSAFRRSLRVSDTRFVIKRLDDSVVLARHAPPFEGLKGLGPCFLVSSRELGMAGLCSLQVSTVVSGVIVPPLLSEEEVLITDGPTVVAPGTVDIAELGQVSAFELRTRTGLMGALSLSPIPSASFNNEGGFKLPGEFPWSAAAEDELTERLNRLFENKGA
jgi:hypothetical protein